MLMLWAGVAFAQDTTSAPDTSEVWSSHFQYTAIGQYHGSFTAPYSGTNSLSSSPESPFSVTATLYLGRRLWEGGEVYVDPEMSGGNGFSSTNGVEQSISKAVTLFGRFSWNDGTTESWVFTEIDRSFQLGASIRGDAWQRANDNVGIAIVANALSPDHRDYLALGGYGFIIGDGRLNYGLEQIVECFYSARLVPWFWLSLDNQIIVNPAYNKDRGPVIDAVAVRGHVEF